MIVIITISVIIWLSVIITVIIQSSSMISYHIITHDCYLMTVCHISLIFFSLPFCGAKAKTPRLWNIWVRRKHWKKDLTSSDLTIPFHGLTLAQFGFLWNRLHILFYFLLVASWVSHFSGHFIVLTSLRSKSLGSDFGEIPKGPFWLDLGESQSGLVN